MGNCPGQHIPSNQPTSYLSRPLSRCLDSLSPHHLNPYYNSSIHLGTSGHVPSCIGSMVVTMSWDGRSVSKQAIINYYNPLLNNKSGGNEVSLVLGSWWI